MSLFRSVSSCPLPSCWTLLEENTIQKNLTAFHETKSLPVCNSNSVVFRLINQDGFICQVIKEKDWMRIRIIYHTRIGIYPSLNGYPG